MDLKREPLSAFNIGKEYLPVKEAIEYTGVAKQTLYSYKNKNNLDTPSIGNKVYFHIRDLDAIIETVKLNKGSMDSGRVAKEVAIDSVNCKGEETNDNYDSKLYKLEQDNATLCATIIDKDDVISNLRKELDEAKAHNKALQETINNMHKDTSKLESLEPLLEEYKTLYKEALLKIEDMQKNKELYLKEQVDIALEANKDISDKFNQVIAQAQNYQILLQNKLDNKSSETNEKKGIFGFFKR